MSRLTEWIDDGETRYAVPRMDLKNNGHRACCNKLAHYEDLAEQGKLLELKYKPGTPAYRVEKYSIGQEWVHTGYDHMGELGYYRNIDRYQIKNVQITLHNMDEVGRNIFLTEAEAKKEKEKRESWEG